eukprot:TRINITY_DN9866_c0_g1_i3.p1 TRINITY_DN9866_c0_g1~~TRINITY_DN9866_c0_g1_i3.p1  ORF type:complete len:518 (-),score=52.82 TRINITY_DN9866_c0_g1_i3:143-1603(-)
MRTCDSLPPLEGASPKTHTETPKDTDQRCWPLWKSSSGSQPGSNFTCALLDDADGTDSDGSSLSPEPDANRKSGNAFQIKQPEAARPVGRRPMVGICVSSQPGPSCAGSAPQESRDDLTSKEERPLKHGLKNPQASFQIQVHDTSNVVAAWAEKSSFSKHDAGVLNTNLSMTKARSEPVSTTPKVALAWSTPVLAPSDAATSHVTSEHFATVDVVQSGKSGKYKSLPVSSVDDCYVEQPRGRARSDFAPSRPTSAKSSTATKSAVVTANFEVKRRNSLLVPGTHEHSAAQSLTPTRPTAPRRVSAPTLSFLRGRSGSFCSTDGMAGQRGSRSPCQNRSRSPCSSERSPRNRERSSSPCPVFSQKADAKGSGKDYNIVQFQATATVSNSRDDGRLSPPRVPRKSAVQEVADPVTIGEVVKLEPKLNKAEAAKEGILKMFAGCSKVEVKDALRGAYSTDDIDEVLTLLGLNESKREKRRSSRNRRESR